MRVRFCITIIGVVLFCTSGSVLYEATATERLPYSLVTMNIIGRSAEALLSDVYEIR